MKKTASFTVLSGLWLLIAYHMAKPQQLSNIMLRFGQITPEQARQYSQQLNTIAGINEAKVNKRLLDKASLHNVCSNAIHN